MEFIASTQNLTLRITEDLTLRSVSRLQKEYRELLERGDFQTLLVIIAGNVHIDSCGISFLVIMFKDATAKNIGFSIRVQNKAHLELFRNTSLTEYITIEY